MPWAPLPRPLPPPRPPRVAAGGGGRVGAAGVSPSVTSTFCRTKAQLILLACRGVWEGGGRCCGSKAGATGVQGRGQVGGGKEGGTCAAQGRCRGHMQTPEQGPHRCQTAIGGLWEAGAKVLDGRISITLQGRRRGPAAAAWAGHLGALWAGHPGALWAGHPGALWAGHPGALWAGLLGALAHCWQQAACAGARQVGGCAWGGASSQQPAGSPSPPQTWQTAPGRHSRSPASTASHFSRGRASPRRAVPRRCRHTRPASTPAAELGLTACRPTAAASASSTLANTRNSEEPWLSPPCPCRGGSSRTDARAGRARACLLPPSPLQASPWGRSRAARPTSPGSERPLASQAGQEPA